MPHFKDTKGELFWLDVQDVEAWKKPDWAQISDAEADTIRAANTPKQDSKTQIALRLSEIDIQSIRALRAVTGASAKGRPVPTFDANKLESLETEATALRAELATLG